MSLNPYEFLTTMERRMLFTAEDKAILKSNASWGQEIAPEMANHFYTYLHKDTEMTEILSNYDAARLYSTFQQWFEEMFTGIDDWGNNYASRRWKIAVVHLKVGITPQYMVPAMATVVNEANKILKNAGKNFALQEALGKICMIDLAFIEQAYVEVCSAAVLQETGWTEKLFRRLIYTGATSL